MSTKNFALSLAALAGAVAVGLYVTLQYFTLGNILLAVCVALGCGIVVLVLWSAGRRLGRGGGGGAASSGGGWAWFGDGGSDGGGWGGGGDGGGGGGGCGGGSS